MPYQRHDKDGNPVTAIASYVRHDKDGNPVALKKYQRHDKDGNAMGPRAEYQRRDSSNTLDSPQPESRTFVDAFGNTYKSYSADYEARDVDGNLLNDFESVFNRSKLDLDFAGNKSLIDAVSGNYLIDHVRDTAPNSSTYVDADGLIKRSVTNLLVYSEEFDRDAGSVTEWGHGADITVTANDREAPNGTLTADKIVQSGTGSYLFQGKTVSDIASSTYTVSLYVYAESEFDFTLRIRGNGSTQEAENFTVSTAANQWKRVSATKAFTASADGTTVVISLYADIQGQSNNRTVWFWGAQLEEASTAGEYVKTTATRSSAPRFDHDPVTGESLGLLVEESRENIMTYSAVTTSNWTNAGATLTDLSLNALGVFPGVRAVSQGQVYQGINTPAVTLTDGTTYTVTFWFRAGDVNPSNMVRFLLRNDTDTKVSTIIKTSTSTNYEDVSAYSQSEGTTGAPTNVNILSVEKLSDGLTYKMSVSFDAVGVDKSHVFGIHTNSDVSGESVIALGLQLEEGSFPTSYIPTEGAAVTRGRDLATITGTNFSSFYNQTASTVFVDWNKPWSGNWPDYESFFSVVAAATPSENFIHFGNTNASNDHIYWTAKASNSSQLDYKQYPANGPGKFKHAMGITTNDAAFAYAGAISDRTDDSITMPTVDRVLIEPTNSHVRRITYWDTRLSNTILETITS